MCTRRANSISDEMGVIAHLMHCTVCGGAIVTPPPPYAQFPDIGELNFKGPHPSRVSESRVVASVVEVLNGDERGVRERGKGGKFPPEHHFASFSG